MFAFLVPTLYIQISPERLTIRNPKTGASISEVPEMAIRPGSKPGILAVGTAARSHRGSASVKITNPFGHPRSMVSDFTVGEQLLKAFVRRAVGDSFFTPSPNVILHLQGNPDGGFTQVEIRAFHEMALGAGASQVKIWQGRLLTDEQLLSGQFPADGQLLS